ncbi:MAG: hypothetical protein JXR37_07650 [Kiritimatiellae bacterium]|nr:hypothetical protein [Kiritimatiellia bacterium]
MNTRNKRKHVFRPSPRAHARRLSVILALAVCPGCALLSEVSVKAPPAETADATAHGALTLVEGVRVLTLRGEPYRRGFAHGSLLAQGVVDMVDAVCGSNLLIAEHANYEKIVLPLVKRFVWTPDEEAELRGIYDGVIDRLGDKAVPPGLGRPLTPDDLKAYNTAGDWYRHACSSFAAWGTLTAQQHVWVGRNFDFPATKAFFAHQLILVHRRMPGKKAWATVSAPGLIGCITGINEHGVFVAVHDVFLPLRPLGNAYVPRLLVLRRMMETCAPRNLEEQALPVLTACTPMFDNNILLAAPVTDGTTPALVFEYNNDPAKPSYATVRRPEDVANELNRQMITCTNRYRKRERDSVVRTTAGAPLVGATAYRSELMFNVVKAKTRRGQPVDFTVGRKAMGAVRVPLTVHTVVADLNTLEFWYAPGEFMAPPGPRDFVKIPVKDWLRQDAEE